MAQRDANWRLASNINSSVFLLLSVWLCNCEFFRPITITFSRVLSPLSDLITSARLKFSVLLPPTDIFQSAWESLFQALSELRLGKILFLRLKLLISKKKKASTIPVAIVEVEIWPVWLVWCWYRSFLLSLWKFTCMNSLCALLRHVRIL